MSADTTDLSQKRRIVRRRPTLAEAQAVAVETPTPATVAEEAAVETATADPVEVQAEAATAAAEPKVAGFAPLIARARAASSARPAWLGRAAAAVAAVGLGWGGATLVANGSGGTAQASAELVRTAESLRQGQTDVIRLTGDVKALKVAVESLADSVERSKNDLGARQRQLAERLDKVDRAPQEAAARLAKLGEQLDRVEASAKGPAQKLTNVDERLERMERQIGYLQAAAAAKSAAAPSAAPAPTPAAAPAAAPAVAPAPVEPTKTATVARDAPVDGWVLHEVYNGMALIESRDRRLLEVGLGAPIPGVGKVEGIERRGRTWVVVTAKGVITMER